MPLSDIADITISTADSQVTREGFGVPLILGFKTNIAPDLVRAYSSLAGMISDGYVVTDPEYKAAQAAFAQNPRPPQIKIGRRTTPPTQRFAITPVVLNSTTYNLIVNGSLVSYLSDSSATAAEIIAGLTTAINALSQPITLSSQTTYLRILANTAGSFTTVETPQRNLLQVVEDNADGGVATDLANIDLVDDDWYALVNPWRSKAEILAAAAWIEANNKIFIASTSDGDVLTSSTSDVMSALHSAAYARTASIYHPSGYYFADAAWEGACLPLDPGSETWKFKTLAGVPAAILTETERANIKTKKGDYYYTVAGRNITAEGIVSADEFIDIVRGRDWLHARLQEDIFTLFINNKKIAFTDAGIAQVQGIILARLLDGVKVGLLSSDPAPIVIVPKASDVIESDKVARNLTGVSFTATLAGAIHKITLQGQLNI